MGVDSLTELLGIGAPVAAASATYGLFKFLDAKASTQANATIGALTRGEDYDRVDLAAAVVRAFDQIYGTPLLSLHSLFRSCAISIVVTLICLALRFRVISILTQGCSTLFTESSLKGGT
jgi:hypothetical protein